MDPTAALNECRAHAVTILAEADRNVPRSESSADPEAFAEAFQALDEWILKGGFLPRSWRESPETISGGEAEAARAGLL